MELETIYKTVGEFHEHQLARLERLEKRLRDDNVGSYVHCEVFNMMSELQLVLGKLPENPYLTDEAKAAEKDHPRLKMFP